MEDGNTWIALGTFAKAAWAWIAPLPGLAAFIWAWRDRKWKRLAELPYAQWRIESEPDENGWHASAFSLKNRWDEPLSGRRIRVKGSPGTVLAIYQHLPTGERVMDFTGASSAHDVDWTFWTSSRTGANPSSGTTILYVKPRKWITSGKAQSGTAQGKRSSSISRLRLEVSLVSASNRHMRIAASASQTKKRITKIRAASPPKK